MTTALARAIEGIPVVATAAERDQLYAAPTRDQRVQLRSTGEIQRYTGTQWVTDLMAGGRLVDIRSAPYLAAMDGVTDDSAAWNAAILAVSAAGGGTIIGAGTTVVADVILRSNVAIVGLGLITFKRPANTAANSFTRLMYIGRGVSSAVKNVTLENVVFDGNIANQINSGVDYNAGTDTIAFRGDFTGTYANVQQNHSLFIGFESGYPGVSCDNIRLLNVRFNGSQGDGVAINQLATNVSLLGCSGRACARGSVDLFGGSSSVKIVGGHFEDWLHIENDNPTAIPSYCEVSSTYATRLNALGPVAGNGLVIEITNCRIDYGPQFEQVGGSVSDTTFNIAVGGSTTTHRIIKGENLKFSDCKFIGTAALTSGALISIEPENGASIVNKTTFEECQFIALGGTKVVNGIYENAAWHPVGSIVQVLNCSFVNLAISIAPRRNTKWRVVGNVFDACGHGFRMYHQGGVSVEAFHASENKYFECDGQFYISDNNAAMGAQFELYDRHWKHATAAFPAVTAAFGVSLVTAVLDRREFYSTIAGFATGAAATTPACWAGARVWITNAAVATDKLVYYKTGTNYDNALAGGRTYLSVALA